MLTDESAPIFALPSWPVLLAFAAVAGLSYAWAYFGLVLAPAAEDATPATDSSYFMWLCAATSLLLLSPLLPWFCAFGCVQQLVHGFLMPLIANVLGLVNVLILIVLVLEPYLPEPGKAASISAICLHVASWRVRFDRAAVVAGPCWQVGASYIMADTS